jgi:hypothetical protein
MFAHRLSIAGPVVNCTLVAPQYNGGGEGGRALSDQVVPLVTLLLGRVQEKIILLIHSSRRRT